MRRTVPRKVANILADVSIGVVLVAILALAAPSLWGWHQAAVLGGSMGRALPVGSVAVLRTVEADTLEVGDIIAIKAAGAHTVMHRITEITSTGGDRIATLKGDANEQADPVPMVLRGKGDRVAYYVPLAGYVFDWARSPLVLVIAAALLLLPDLANGARGRLFRFHRPAVRSMATRATTEPARQVATPAAGHHPPTIQDRMRPNREAARPSRS
jgi:signal peptidase I